MSRGDGRYMTSDRFAVSGLLFMLAAVALAALGAPMSVVAAPLAASLALAVCAAHDEFINRSSRR